MRLSSPTKLRFFEWGHTIGVVAFLAVSALMLAAAPVLLPGDYNWVAHTTSEAAAQRVDGAWLARSGFLFFGLGVIWLAAGAREIWGSWARFLHILFGVFMISAAVFSARSWNPAVPFDKLEDHLHSFAATAMGFAFAFGVLAVLLFRVRNTMNVRWLDIGAITASILIPLAMSFRDDVAGVFQRLMFVIAYLWYGREAFLSLQVDRSFSGELGARCRAGVTAGGQGMRSSDVSR